MLANPYALRERSVTGVTKRLPYEGGGEDPNDRKGKLPKKTCGNGSPTTTYGAPTADEEFNVLRVSRLFFNDRRNRSSSRSSWSSLLTLRTPTPTG